MSRDPHAPTETSRKLVQLHATIGTQQHTIAGILGIDDKTLRKYYRDELDQSMAQANATIGGALFNKAKGGDTAAMIFWMKTRAGWKERQEIDHTTNGKDLPGAITMNMTPQEAAEAYARAINPDGE